MPVGDSDSITCGDGMKKRVNMNRRCQATRISTPGVSKCQHTKHLSTVCIGCARHLKNVLLDVSVLIISILTQYLQDIDHVLTFCRMHSHFCDCSANANAGNHRFHPSACHVTPVGLSASSKLIDQQTCFARYSRNCNGPGTTIEDSRTGGRQCAEAKSLLRIVQFILVLSMAHMCDAYGCFRSSATGCPPKPSNARFAVSGPLELTLSWDPMDASTAVTSYSVIYLNEWYEQVIFDAGLQTSFTFSSEGVTSVDGQSIQTTKGAEFQVTVLATNNNGQGYYITPFLTAISTDLPSPPTTATLCANKLLSEQYLCATSSSERLRWGSPSDLGAGEGVPVAILAFHIQSGESEEEMTSAPVITVDPSSALQPDGLYQTDRAAGSVARVWVETAAGTSTAETATLSGSCAGELLVSVLFGAGSTFESWGATADSDVVLSLEITIGSLLPGSSVVLLILPDGFHFIADPEPVLTHRNSGGLTLLRNTR